MNSSELLGAFCQDLITDISKRVQESSDDNESSVLLHTYETKCKAILAEVKGKDEKKGKGFIFKCLKSISQLVLDITYVKEIQLVEDEFPLNSSESDIKYIIDSLTSLELLSKSVCPDDDTMTCLGPEILECLRWRKGALLYMFCHTVYHRNPALGIPSHQLHYIEDGVSHLISMLKTRCDAKWIDASMDGQTEATVDAGNSDGSDTLQLIEQGIFSDTHLLALMYCGELCYWHSLCNDKAATSKRDEGGKNKVKLGKEHSDVVHAKKLSESEAVKTTDLDTTSHSKIRPEIKEGSSDLVNSDSTKSTINETFAANKSSNGSSKKKDADARSDCASLNSNQKGMNLVQTGNSCLKKYISVTQGPLASAGWNTDHAKDIIDHFQKLKL